MANFGLYTEEPYLSLLRKVQKEREERGPEISVLAVLWVGKNNPESKNGLAEFRIRGTGVRSKLKAAGSAAGTRALFHLFIATLEPQLRGSGLTERH